MKNLMKKPTFILIAIAIVLAATAARAEAPAPIQAVAKVDLNRYVGKWFEIALLPNRFQAMCVADTTADYASLSDGNIQVTNRCRNADGNIEEAIGVATNDRGDTSNAKLKVRFAPWWLGFLPQVWGDYWVIELDADYRYSVVSEPGRKFLWILSRTPTMNDVVYQDIVMRLQAKGYDTARLSRTPQSGGKSAATNTNASSAVPPPAKPSP